MCVGTSTKLGALSRGRRRGRVAVLACARELAFRHRGERHEPGGKTLNQFRERHRSERLIP